MGAHRRASSVLEKIDYQRAFEVLECCDTAACLPDFKEQMVEGLLRHFKLRHVSFFTGATFHNVFGDQAPVTEGQTARMLPEYQERWCRYDVFGTPAAMRQLVATGISSVSELAAFGPLPASADAYVRHFLVGTWGMESAAAMRLELPGGHTALVGMFDPKSERLGVHELATMRLLSRQLSAICRGLPNAQIAETLSLAEDSVKKYVSRILSATGCQSRMELALLARSQRNSR